MKKGKALLIIDVQNDFCPGGALAVPGGDRVVGPLSRIAAAFAAAGLPVLASRDWHPAVTTHFSGFGGVWPPHCLQQSFGAAFHPALQLPKGALLISKGSEPDSDSYSVFDGQSADGCRCGEILAELDVGHLYVGGLATDYCVRSSVLDAIKAALDVTVLTDAIAGVEISEGDSEKALQEMGRAGACFCSTDEAVSQITGTPA
ncbi:MAG: isochorismatase family protein [Desulfuromonadaceae bacterium]